MNLDYHTKAAIKEAIEKGQIRADLFNQAQSKAMQLMNSGPDGAYKKFLNSKAFQIDWIFRK